MEVNRMARTGSSSNTANLGSERRIITAAVLLSLVMSTLLVFGAVLIGASNLNETALRSSRALASAIFARETETLARLTADNSWWDVAREHLIDELDPLWADDNIGSYMHETFDVTSVFVLDTAGRVIIAFHQGEQTAQDPDELLGPDLRKFALAHNMSTAVEAPPSVSGVFLGTDGFCIVAVSPITPEYEVEGEIGPVARPVLIFARKLDNAFVSNLGDELTLSGLTVSENSVTGEAEVSLPGLLYPVVGYASWNQPYPGRRLVTQVAVPAAAMLIAISLLGALVLRRANTVIAARQVLAGELTRERALREMKSRFVSMISHEIRTPLANIQSAADIVGRYGAQMSLAEQKREFAEIGRAVSNIDDIIEDVLSLDRLESDDSAIKTTSVPLAEFCQETWDTVAEDNPDSHQFVLSTPGHPIVARTDPKLFRTVLSNLFQNARKYAPEGTKVRVELSCDKTECRVTVIDQGCGIPNAETDLIFDPFYRGSNTMHIPGIGLGLAIVKTAMEHLNGTISVRSQKGGGACFIVTLPCASS